MSGKNKRPKTKLNPDTSKTPRIGPGNEPESIYSKKPAWKLGLIDLDGPWDCRAIEFKECLLRIHAFLKDLEGKTWSQIDDRRYNHGIPIYRLPKEAKKRLEELGLGEYDTLYRFRLSGAERLWGIREQECLYLLWWDPNHTVYPTGD